MGAYLRWVLIQGWALIKFSPFSTSVVCIFCKKTVNGNNKTRRCNKAIFLQNTLKKTLSSGKSQISTYSFFLGGSGKGVGAYLSLSGSGRWGGVGWGWRLFEAGCLLTFSAFRMGTYSRWALIRGWVLIPINMVSFIIPKFSFTSLLLLGHRISFVILRTLL